MPLGDEGIAVSNKTAGGVWVVKTIATLLCRLKSPLLVKVIFLWRGLTNERAAHERSFVKRSSVREEGVERERNR